MLKTCTHPLDAGHVTGAGRRIHGGKAPGIGGRFESPEFVESRDRVLTPGSSGQDHSQEINERSHVPSEKRGYTVLHPV
jgi:hypothetical protein